MKARCLLLLLLGLQWPLLARPAYVRLAVPSGEKHPIGKASTYLSHQCDWNKEAQLYVQVAGLELGDEAEVLLQLRFGGVSMAVAHMEELCDAVPALIPFSEILKGLPAEERKSYCQSHWQELESLLEENGMAPLAAFKAEFHCLYSNATLPDTLKGKTIGTKRGSYIQDKVREQGARPFSSDPSDFSTLLSNHMVDAVGDRFLDFCLSPNWAFAHTLAIGDEDSLPSFILVSLRVWDKLDETQRQLLQKAAQKATIYGDTLIDRAQDDWISLSYKEKQIMTGGW